ncbi:MAG: efflux RND transporter periplasmic adaptor subunit [Planctomycetes bacterium]|nr:efflux RND transporter periplasmic adaptor subunit [Planctomycetota bacterium]
MSRVRPILLEQRGRSCNAWMTVAKSTFLVSIVLVIGLGPPPVEHVDITATAPGSNHQIAAEAAADSAASTVIPGQRSPAVERVIGVVQPFRTASLASVRQGPLASIAAPEGTRVTAGDPIFRLVDEAQRVRVQIAKAKAETTLAVELARARWEQARQQRDRLVDLHGEANATPKEYSDAVSEEAITHLEFEQARFKHAQDILAYELEQARLDEFHARAPFDGYVSRQIKEVGETIYQREFVVTVVQLNPLLVVVDCPLELAPRVHPGDRLTVRPMDDHWSPRQGTVVLINAVADAASQTFKVKLTVDNEDGGWTSGMKVVVEFPQRPADDGSMARTRKTGVTVAEKSG